MMTSRLASACEIKQAIVVYLVEPLGCKKLNNCTSAPVTSAIVAKTGDRPNGKDGGGVAARLSITNALLLLEVSDGVGKDDAVVDVGSALDLCKASEAPEARGVAA
jgi:hypothetical protein